jgi:hypothetical protein
MGSSTPKPWRSKSTIRSDEPDPVLDIGHRHAASGRRAGVDEAPGKLTLCAYERHEIGKPGMVIRVPLDLFVIERMHDLSGKVLWHHVRSLGL